MGKAVINSCYVQLFCNIFLFVFTLCRILSAKRQYGEIVNLLQGIIEVMTHFKNYSDIPQIAQLSVEVSLYI